MDNRNPAISVIMSMYNVEKYVGYSLESILSQKFGDYELILVDDASTDSTLEICHRKCDGNPDVIILENEANRGQYFCRNKGLEIARGKYVFFMDSDDEILPHALSVFYENAERNRADVVHNNVFFISYAEGAMIYKQSLWQACGDVDKSLGTLKGTLAERVRTVGFRLPMPWLNLIRRDFLTERKIKFRPLRISEDDVFFLELGLKAKKFVMISEPVNIYRKYYNEKERFKKRLPWIFGVMGNVIEAYSNLFNEFTEKEIPYAVRLDVFTGWLRMHLRSCFYDFMDTRTGEGYRNLKGLLQPFSADNHTAGLVQVLVSLLDFHASYRKEMECEIGKEKKNLLRSFQELEAGKNKGDYAYMYCLGKRASILEWDEEDDRLLVWRYLARAAFQLGKHREAWEAYKNALACAGKDSKEKECLDREQEAICPYLEDEDVFDNVPTAEREAIQEDKLYQTGDGLVLGIYMHYCNLTDGMLCCWRGIIDKLPGAKLVIVAGEFEVQAMMIEAMERFLDSGFDGMRICLAQPKPTWLQSVDILLDTYPVSQGDMLAESLLQGIPAVTLCGKVQESQSGASILVKAGLEELVARSGAEYVEKVVALGKDKELLSLLKNNLPQMLSGK